MTLFIQNNIFRIVLATALALLIPLVAMQFYDDVNWTPIDFAVAGALLLGTGLIYELAVKRVRNINYRVILSIGLAVAFLLIWVELAVGLFGTPFSGS